MCDYSLHAQPNRLAIEGERLVVHRFFRGSIGLAAPADLVPRVLVYRGMKPRRWWSWASVQTWLQGQEEEPRATCAVCVPPGSRLVVRDFPQNIQDALNVNETEQVTFVQLSAREFTYRDAIRFGHGSTLLLQQLSPGQRVDVLSVHSDDVSLEPERQIEASEYLLHERCA